MSIVHRIKNKIAQKIARSKNETLLQKVINNPDNFLSQLGKSIQFVTDSHELSGEEKKALSSIESLRKEPENSNEIIIMKDFGVGKPDAQLLISEME